MSAIASGEVTSSNTTSPPANTSPQLKRGADHHVLDLLAAAGAGPDPRGGWRPSVPVDTDLLNQLFQALF